MCGSWLDLPSSMLSVGVGEGETGRISPRETLDDLEVSPEYSRGSRAGRLEGEAPNDTEDERDDSRLALEFDVVPSDRPLRERFPEIRLDERSATDSPDETGGAARLLDLFRFFGIAAVCLSKTLIQENSYLKTG